jgi:hypothetical protein
VGTTRARQRCAEDNTPWNRVGRFLERHGIRVDDYYEWDRESGEHGYAGINAGDNIAAR